MRKTRNSMIVVSTLLFAVHVLTAGVFAAEPKETTSEPAKVKPSTVTVQQPTLTPNQPITPARTVVPIAPVSIPMTGEQIKWQVISSGGNRSTSTNYTLSGTAGQTAVGTGASTNFRLSQGFWQNFGSGNCCTAATTGDVDESGIVDISDLQAFVDYLFNGVPFVGACFQEQDVDTSGNVDISDLQALVDYLFNGVSISNCS